MKNYRLFPIYCLLLFREWITQILYYQPVFAWERASDDYKVDSPFQLKAVARFVHLLMLRCKDLTAFFEWNNRGNTYRPIRRKNQFCHLLRF